MKTFSPLSFAAALLVAYGLATVNAEPSKAAAQEESQTAILKIQEKLKAGRTTEADLAENMKELDGLIAKFKTSDSNSAAGISIMKAQLYAQVLDNYDKATEVLNQVMKDFAGSEAASVADRFLNQLKALSESKTIQGSLAKGSTFPSFAEKDLAGKPLSPANYKGKVVLIDFWATWCGPCRAELPNVIETYKKYHGQGFEIIGISLDQDQSKLETFLKANGMTWAQYFDGKGWQNKLSGKYGVNSIPATYLLDKEGKIIAKDLRGDELTAAVAKALK